MEREILEIQYIGIDYWSRPIFKPLDKTKKVYLSDVNNLFSENTSEQEIKEFYKNLEPLRDYITLHGSKIDVDPHGGQLKYDLKIV